VLKLLYTLTTYPPSIGGAQLHFHQLACQLKNRHSIQVVTQWDDNRTDWLLGTTFRAPGKSYAYQIDGISVERIGLSQNSRLRLLPWALAYPILQGSAIEMIAGELSKVISPWAEKADLIHNCRIGREGISFASLKLARQQDIPFIFTPFHHPRWSGWFHRYYHNLYRQADAVIVLTGAEKKIMISLGVEEKRIHITGMAPTLVNGGDGQRFRDSHKLGSAPVILFLAQKYPYKGVKELLDSSTIVWKKFPETVFLFIGPRTTFSDKLFNEIKDARILELDSMSPQSLEKSDALAACTLLCVPSSQESFGGVYTEAWNFSKPVIGCDIPAVAEVIHNGEDGYLVNQNPEQIAERIVYLLENPSEAKRLGDNGRNKVEARFTWPKLAEMTEKIYLDCLAGR
jgi:glycosyltransferase involved in cell wall biosynthesis